MLDKLYALKEKYEKEVIYAQAKLDVVMDMLNEIEVAPSDTESETTEYSSTENVL